MLNTVEPSVPQVPLWHGFIDGISLFNRTLVCPGELLQAGSTIYRLPRRQKPIFVAGAVFGGRPQNGLGWAYKGAGFSVPKSSASFGRGPQAVGPQPIRR